MKSISKQKSAYFTGIGGIGVSAIAKIYLKLGKKVFGSDPVKSQIIEDLKKHGAVIYPQPDKKHVSNGVDNLIYSPAVPFGNPERVRARELKIPEMSYPEVLGEISKEKKTIAISGTHGKSTTTALIGLILSAAKIDPTVIVGSQVKSFGWDGNLRLGKSQYFVAEACEYRAHMLNVNPWAIVLTNLEPDHLDYYKGLNDIIKHFEKFVLKLPRGGLLAINGNNDGCKKLLNKKLENILKNRRVKIINYGLELKTEDRRIKTKDQRLKTQDLRPITDNLLPFNITAKNIKVRNGLQTFEIVFNKKNLGEFKLPVPGEFNIYNALAAVSLSLQFGVKKEIIKKVLNNYHGIWRRFEIVGKVKNTKAIAISDYAHHPTAVRDTIQAAKELYPGRKLLVVFQPHQHNRTKKLFKEFLQCFNGLDKNDLLILNEIYDVTGREEKNDQNISSQDIVKRLKKKDFFSLYSKDLNRTKKLILKKAKDFDVVLIMGAGDIDEVAREIVN